jgi:hypothetical protein
MNSGDAMMAGRDIAVGRILSKSRAVAEKHPVDIF